MKGASTPGEVLGAVSLVLLGVKEELPVKGDRDASAQGVSVMTSKQNRLLKKEQSLYQKYIFIFFRCRKANLSFPP